MARNTSAAPSALATQTLTDYATLAAELQQLDSLEAAEIARHDQEIAAAQEQLEQSEHNRRAQRLADAKRAAAATLANIGIRRGKLCQKLCARFDGTDMGAFVSAVRTALMARARDIMATAVTPALAEVYASDSDYVRDRKHKSYLDAMERRDREAAAIKRLHEAAARVDQQIPFLADPISELKKLITEFDLTVVIPRSLR